MPKLKYLFFCLYLSIIGAVSAQPRMSANVDKQHLGQIMWKRAVTVDYTITNTGTSPLQINDVEADCACTVVNWTKTPILPKSKGVISLTYDAKALGSFQKSIAVYSNVSNQPSYFYLTGQVVAKLTDYSSSHPYRFGDIRIDSSSVSFGDVYYGGKPEIHLSVANLSNQPYEPVLMHLPSYMTIESSPSVISEGEMADVKITLLTENVGDFGLIKMPVYLSRFMGDKVGPDNELPLSFIILPDLSNLSAVEAAPVASLSLDNLDFSSDLKMKTKVKKDILITNTGKSDLHILKLQVLSTAVNVSLKKNVIKTGEVVRMRIAVNRNHIKGNDDNMKVLMITDDPKNEKILIDIKGK